MQSAPFSSAWWAIALRGVAAVVFGILALVLPGVTFAVLVLLFGSYALVEGLFNVIAAARGRVGGAPRWALALEGLVSIGAGVVTFAMPGLTMLVLLYVIAAWAVVTGVLEIVAAMRIRRHVTGEWRLAASGVLSIVFGGLMLAAPGAGALALVLWMGVYAIVFGGLLIALAFRLRRSAVHAETPMARAA